MEVVEFIKSSPEWAALFVSLAWNVYLQKQVTYLQGRIERVSDRADTTKDVLIGKLTKTDLGEGRQ